VATARRRGNVRVVPGLGADSTQVFVTEGSARVRFRIADGRREVVHSFEGLRQLSG